MPSGDQALGEDARWWGRPWLGIRLDPGDSEIAQRQPAQVPQDVVPSAEQNQIGRAAVDTDGRL